MRRGGGLAGALCAVAAALAISACGSSSGVKQAELRSAIDAHLAKTPRCIGDIAWRFPVDLRQEYDRVMEPEWAAMLERLDTFVRLGLVRSRPVPDAPWGRPKRYELTDAGQQAYREFPAGRWDPRKPAGALCYGTPVVDSIIRYTAPAETMGAVQTEVTYSYRLQQVAPWAGDTALQRLHPQIGRELGREASRPEARAILVRASDGWQVVALP